MCRLSRKNPYPPHGRSYLGGGRWGGGGGGGVLKVKILEAKYEAKLEFPENVSNIDTFINLIYQSKFISI